MIDCCHQISGASMIEVYINRDAYPYVLDTDGTLDVAGLFLLPASIVINRKEGLVDAETCKTKLSFADMQQNILHDSMAGSMAHPLEIQGIPVAGRLDLQHLLGTPLPPLNASEPKDTSSQVATPLTCHPATVQAWSNFSDRVASHIASLDGGTQSCSPIVLPVTKVSQREAAVVFNWHSVVTRTMNCVWQQNGCDLQWQADHSDLPIDSMGAQRIACDQVKGAQATFDRQQFLGVALHRLRSTQQRPLAVIDHRSSLHELFASCLDIVQIWNLEQECTPAMRSNVLSATSQVTRHAAVFGIKYVALSDYEGTIFGMFCAPDQLLLSKLIRFDAAAPSVLECIHAITAWASSEDMHQPWTPGKEHAPSEKAVGHAANSRRHACVDAAGDESDHSASHSQKEAAALAGKLGKRQRDAAAQSSSTDCRSPKKTPSLSSVFTISAVVPHLQQQWREQKEGQHMLPDLEASAAAFCLTDICGVVGKGASGHVFAARLQSGLLAAVKLAKVGTAEAHMLQREAKAYQHCKQLQYQVLPGVLAAGLAMDGTAYLLATCLLPVVGLSNCLSAKYQALHAVKALHSLRTLHGDIRESNILCISESEQSCKMILIDLGHSHFCTQEAVFQEELLLARQLFT